MRPEGVTRLCGQLLLRVRLVCGAASSWDLAQGEGQRLGPGSPHCPPWLPSPGLLLAARGHGPALHFHLHRGLPPGVGRGQGRLRLLPGLCVPHTTGW